MGTSVRVRGVKGVLVDFGSRTRDILSHIVITDTHTRIVDPHGLYAYATEYQMSMCAWVLIHICISLWDTKC